VKPACPRLFEAEALRDGRLSGAELARFQAHSDVCASCSREARALQALGDLLRAPTSSADADELHVRRERTRLLAAFDASLVPDSRGSRPTLWVAMFAALGGLAVAIALWQARSASSPPVTTAVEIVKVRAEPDAKWSRQTAARSETVRLESGTLAIHVDHARSPERRLLVILPDGELEDIGTTFSVSAAASHTTEVTVQEGRVILRLHGKPALALSAGDSWTPAPPPVATHAPLGAPLTPTLRSAKPAASTPVTLANPVASAAPAPVAVVLDPAADFRDAMAALNNGNNARAANLFVAFLVHHPHDSHAEDAAYLRVLALQRAGDATGMKQAASAYLNQYPRGFRHAEVEPLSR
jgi:hypothetical protein